MDKLEGKIALITGGNSGIGLATAKQFVNEGAYVFITGRRKLQLAAAVKEIGKNVTGVQGDVSNFSDLDRLFAQIKQEKGTLDVVFANAGVAKFAPFGTITEEFYDSIFDINVKGPLFTVQKALPLLPLSVEIRQVLHQRAQSPRQAFVVQIVAGELTLLPHRQKPAHGKNPQVMRNRRHGHFQQP